MTNEDELEQVCSELEAIIIEEATEEQPKYTPEPFCLCMGTRYNLACAYTMLVVHEDKQTNTFLGVIDSNGMSVNPLTSWYSSDGRAIGRIHGDEEDPFDVVSEFREPYTVFLIRKDNAFVHNNCFFTRDAAVRAASERGGTVIQFTEVPE